MARRKSSSHSLRGPRWDAGNRSGRTSAPLTRSHAPQPAAGGSATCIDPVTLWRSTLTPAQLRAGIADDIDPHRLAEHARLFGWRRHLPKDWSWS
jgi:hypothetical protein